MSTATSTAKTQTVAPRAHRHWGGPVVGGFYLTMGGVHLGLVAAGTETYRLADHALFGVVRDRWQELFMARPEVFGLLLMAAEITLGILLLRGGRAATVGWAGVVLFHLLLMLFGWGIWLWCLPALALLIHLARHDTTALWGHPATRRHRPAGDLR